MTINAQNIMTIGEETKTMSDDLSNLYNHYKDE